MPTIDFGAIAGILLDLGQSILTYSGIALILYNIGGIVIRTVSWSFDKLIINFITYGFKYFEMIINGELLTDSIVRGMMDRVYLLVGVFVLFRLGMLLFNYMINPSEVMDEKVGVNALIKRIVLGLILMIFMPEIFGYAFRLQEAIFADMVIERIIMPESEINQIKVYKEEHGMGKIIGMTVFQGFFNLSSKGKSVSKARTNFEKATEIDQDYDLSVIDNLEMKGFMNSGILAESGGTYLHDYFPIFSTVVLCFVLYKIVQFCLDAVVRSFKLSVLQVLAPIAIVEYMINSDRNEVFKSWKKAVVGTFAMLFMRVASLWFVAYVAMLMQPGATSISSESLLQTGDNLLKSVILLGLLAFMMDFPKMMSDIFGLDLDQSGSVKAVMGKAMAGATAGLALGGAAVGAMAKPVRGGLNVARAGLGSALKDTKMGKKLKNWNDKVKSATTISGTGRTATAFRAMQEQAKKEHIGTSLKAGALAMGSAVLASNQFTKSAQGGYQQSSNSVEQAVGKVDQKEKAAAQEKLQNEQMDIMREINVNTTVSNAQQAAANLKLDSIIDNTETTAQHIVNVDATLGKKSGEGRKYADGTLVSDMSKDEFGRNTTYRAERSKETGMQQRVNDAAHVHDPKNATEIANYVENSAFANISDDAFIAYQEAGGVKPEMGKIDIETPSIDAGSIKPEIGKIDIETPSIDVGGIKPEMGKIDIETPSIDVGGIKPEMGKIDDSFSQKGTGERKPDSGTLTPKEPQ